MSSPIRPASPGCIAKVVRSQWIIENHLHFVRDATFAEDTSKVRAGHDQDNVANLRSFGVAHTGHRKGSAENSLHSQRWTFDTKTTRARHCARNESEKLKNGSILRRLHSSMSDRLIGLPSALA